MQKKKIESNEKSYLKTFAGGESDCTLSTQFVNKNKTFQAPGNQLCFYTSLKC